MPDPLRIEQHEERALLGMVRTRGIPVRGTDPAEALPDQRLPGEPFVRRVPLVARLLVQQFGERLGEPVCERAHHDRAIVVERGRETVSQLIRPVDRDGKRAQVVGEPGFRRRHEVG